MAKILSKQDILAANDMRREEVEVPEWGGSVYVRSLSADEKDSFEFKMYTQKQTGRGIRAAYVGLSLVDDMGVRLFTDEEVPMLGTKFAGAVDRVFEVVSRLNRISEKDLDDLEKNSEAGPGAGSPSA